MTAILRRPTGSTWLKLAGLALLLVPIGLLLLFAAGEGLEGVQHLVQLAPLLALAVLAWYRPRLGGALLAGIGLALAAAYPFFFHFPLGATLVTIALFFAPAVLVGGLFLLAGREPDGPVPTGPTIPASRA
jgi:hypothetical protein